jgi:hypothetical protein
LCVDARHDERLADSEVLQKVRQHGAPAGVVARLLASYGLTVVDVTRADAEIAAARGNRGPRPPLGGPTLRSWGCWGWRSHALESTVRLGRHDRGGAVTGPSCRVALAIGLVLAVGGCAAAPNPSDWSEPLGSVAPDDRTAGEAALEAFLAAMAEPDVTYRVNGQLTVLPIQEHNRAALDIRTRYDVKGDNYAGSAYLAGWDRPQSVGGSVSIAVMDGTAHVVTGMDFDRSVDVAPPPSMRRPTELQALTAADLELVGVDADGLFEFALERWVHGDPIGEWSDLQVVPAVDFPPTTVRSHRTRLFLDASGAPIRLVTSWTFDPADPVGDGSGTIVEDFEGLGMYVTLAERLSPFMPTSHDIIVGVDAEHQVITEPWREVAPVGDNLASVEITFAEPDQPIMLGIEGAIGFIGSHDAGGATILERIINLPGSTEVDIAAGAQTFVVFYRPCDGGCALLDPSHELCRVDADIDPAGRYRLLVEPHDRDRATCTLAESN